MGGFSGLTLRALPEGRVAHPQVPLVSVEGPLLQAQLLETALLNRLNYETLIATKASRVREAAGRPWSWSSASAAPPPRAGRAPPGRASSGGEPL